MGKTRTINSDRRRLLYQDPRAFFSSAEEKSYDFINQHPGREFFRDRKAAAKYLRDIGLPLQ